MKRVVCDRRHIRRRGTWRSLDGTNGLPGPVLCFHQDQDGYLWMGTWGCGVALYDGNTITTLGIEEGLTGDRVWAIAEDGTRYEPPTAGWDQLRSNDSNDAR